MRFIKSMTCYSQHRGKGIHYYNKMLIVDHSCYHGYRKKEQPNNSVPKDYRLLRLYRGVQLYPHGRTRLTTIPCAQGKGCLTSSNLSLIRTRSFLGLAANIGWSDRLTDTPVGTGSSWVARLLFSIIHQTCHYE